MKVITVYNYESIFVKLLTVPYKTCLEAKVQEKDYSYDARIPKLQCVVDRMDLQESNHF